MKKLLTLFIAVMLLAAFSACAGDGDETEQGSVVITTARISEATMALGVDDEYKPIDPTTVFSPDTPEIFCSVKLSYAPDNTELASTWIYVGGEAEGLENYEIDSYAMTANGTRYVRFSLTRPDTGFPRGDYALVLTIDGLKVETLGFSVE